MRDRIYEVKMMHSHTHCPQFDAVNGSVNMILFALKALILSASCLRVSSQPLQPPGFEELIHTVLLNQLALSDMLQNKNNCTGIPEIAPSVAHQSTVNNDVLREVRESFNNLKDEIKIEVNEFLNNLKAEVRAEITEEQCASSPSKNIASGFLENNSLMPITVLGNSSTEHHDDCPKGLPVDCLGYRRNGHSISGVYQIYPSSCCKPVRVFCDMDTDGGGWTVFLAREPRMVPVDFNRGWDDYKNGFGNPWTEYWLGNENLHQLTGAVPHILRVDAEDYKGFRKYGLWFLFSVGDLESKYQLKVDEFNQQLSKFGNSLTGLNGVAFSTTDNDNDKASGHCAKSNGAWWHNACGYVYPTLPIITSEGTPTNQVSWAHWNHPSSGSSTLRWLQFKIRSKDFIGPARVCRHIVT